MTKKTSRTRLSVWAAPALALAAWVTTPAAEPTAQGADAISSDTVPSTSEAVQLASLDLKPVRSAVHRAYLGHLEEVPTPRQSTTARERARQRERRLEDAEQQPTERHHWVS